MAGMRSTEVSTKADARRSPLRLVRRIVAAVAVAAVIAAIAALGVWLYIKDTPQYALYLTGQALQNRDYAEFTKYVDIDAVVYTAVDQEITKTEKQQTDQTVIPADDDFDRLGRRFTDDFTSTLRPALAAEIKREVRTQVESGEFRQQIHSDSVTDTYGKVRSVDRKGDTAQVVVVADNGRDFTIKMRKVEGRWRIYELPFETRVAP
ncbi:MAG TPA: hypothetical protein VIF43_03780 [Patescibacteria group bacterium]|jgi:hypothetical protein